MKNKKNSQSWRVNGKFVKFKDFVKANGTDSVIYDNLTKSEKATINGLERSTNRLGGKYIKPEVAYKIKQLYTEKIDKQKFPTLESYKSAAKKSLTEVFINSKMNYTYNLNSIKHKIDLYDVIYINGKPVTRQEAKENILAFNIFKQQGTTIDGMFEVQTRPLTKELFLNLPTAEELEEIAEMDEEDQAAALEEYGITIYKSEEKTPEQIRAAKDKANAKARQRRLEKKTGIRRD
jgi:hypothetical protein